MGPDESCKLLNVRPPSLAGCASVEQAKERLAAWKTGPLKSAYKDAAKIAHPDRAGGSDEAMKAVNAAYALLRDGLEIVVPRPKPNPQRSARQGFARREFTSTSATGATTTGGFGGFGSVTFIIY